MPRRDRRWSRKMRGGTREGSGCAGEEDRRRRGTKFSGLQAYQGAAQHIADYGQRKANIAAAVEMVQATVTLLQQQGLQCEIVGGAGTGSYYFEGASGVYNELQCGSYIFMDADYKPVKDKNGEFIHEFENS